MQRATTGSPFYGMVVIDERNNQQNKQLDNFHFDLLNNHDSRRADYNNLVEDLFIAASACNSRIWSLEPSTARYPKAIRVSTM